MFTHFPSPVTFGLIAWLESTRIALPLKGVEGRFSITAGLASVEIDQIYYQNNPRPLDCAYSFPLPADAAVHRCEIHINDRVIRALIKDKGEAQRLYREKKVAGHRAALVESERDNLFTLSLGNIQPGDVIVVRIAYVEKLDRHGPELRLRIPVCPGIRYIPGRPLLRSSRGTGTETETDEVPDASRLTPPRIDALHPDAAYFALSGTLVLSDAAAETLESRTHSVVVSTDETAWRMQLAESSETPDRDFVIGWREPIPPRLEARAWQVQTPNGAVVRLQLRAPAASVAANVNRPPADVYFLVDRSGSMAGAKWVKTCEALQTFAQILAPQDRMAVTFFESSFQDFAEAPLPAATLRADPAFRDLVNRGTDGGTELLPAARHVLAMLAKHSAGRDPRIVLITDGQVGNEAAVIEAFQASAATPLSTIGIDTAVNDLLLRRLAAQQGGLCRLLTPDDDIAAAVCDAGSCLRSPAWSDLRVIAPWLSSGPRLPVLYDGGTIEFFCERTDVPDGALTLQGKRADGSSETIALFPEPSLNEAIPLLHARERIVALEAANDDAGAKRLSLQYSLLCRSTAFVAWDEAEKVVIATEELHQPSRWPDHGLQSHKRCMIRHVEGLVVAEREQPELCVAHYSPAAEATPHITSAQFLMHLRLVVSVTRPPKGWSELMDALEIQVIALTDPTEQIALCREFVQKQIEVSELQADLLVYLKNWEQEVSVG